MTWPDTYKDRYEAAQRLIRLLHEHSILGPALTEALAADPEALVEFAHAIGTLDGLIVAAEAAAAEDES